MLGGIGSVGRCVAAQTGSPVTTDAIGGTEREREARPDQRVTAEQDRDRSAERRGRQLAELWIGDALGGAGPRRPVLGHRPRGLVGTDVVGEQDVAVDDAASPSPAT